MSTPEQLLRKRNQQLEANLEHSQTLYHQMVLQSAEIEKKQFKQDPAFMAQIARGMEILPNFDCLLPPPQQTYRNETRSEQKKRESAQKQMRQAQRLSAAADAMAGSYETVRRRGQRVNAPDAGLSDNEYQQERAILDARLKAIDAKEGAQLTSYERLVHRRARGIQDAPDPRPLEEQKAELLMELQKARVEAYANTAAQMPLESKERAALLAEKEEAVLKLGRLTREYKVACMPAGKEKERETATIKRHAKFDALKKFFKLFSKPCPHSHEDASVTVEGKELVNVGRATLGGTKAMYIFEEHQTGDAPPQQWLFKEATNCVGISKPEGAIVTEAASRLQNLLRGDLSIPAYCLKDTSGKVLGSIQKRMQKAEGGVDLFKWQAQGDLRENAPTKTTLDDLMHEHTLDWILCNFDTKGENFINQPNDHIISFDKEASFNTLLQEESKHMSYTFKPHSNDTIYNTMFSAFARGEIELDLDANMESIQKLEAVKADDFIALFRETLDVKYGTSGADREQAEQVLRERHRNLRREYRAFYTQLLRERLAVTRDPDEREKLHGMMEEGTFIFKDEREGTA